MPYSGLGRESPGTTGAIFGGESPGTTAAIFIGKSSGTTAAIFRGKSPGTVHFILVLFFEGKVPGPSILYWSCFWR